MIEMSKVICNKVSITINEKKKQKVIRKWNSAILKARGNELKIPFIDANEKISNQIKR